MVTERLEIRHPVDADRPRFLELFSDPAFMVYSDGVMSEAAASERFDRMLARCRELAFPKQPIAVFVHGELHIERELHRVEGCP